MISSETRRHSGSFKRHRFLRGVVATIKWFVLVLLNLWAVAAIYVDCRIPSLRIVLAVAYLATLIFLIVKNRRLRGLSCLVCFCVVLVWWLSLKPSDSGDWEEDDARRAWTEISGDQLTVHNLRNCDYQTETVYTNCWSDRTYNLSGLRAVDFFFINWGVRWIGHPIVSFDFGNNQHLAFSIEARYKKGQSYSAILGFFRQYELIFIAADERDVIRLRTNYRKDEEVYMYRTNVTPAVARKFLSTYTDYLNHLRDHPEWYNAATKNCTTTLDTQLTKDMPSPMPWNYQLLLNGTLDELLYDRGRFVTGGLPFPELKEREHINPFAHTVNQSPDFSALIRQGRVGFDNLTSSPTTIPTENRSAMSSDKGITTISSNHSVDQTVEKLKTILQAKGVTLFGLIDHSGEAEKAGLKMLPTKLLIFGSPKAGTPLMLAAPSAAIDLPLKILVWQDSSGKVWISYNSPAYLQQRHSLPPELLQNIAVVETLATAAAA